MGSHYGFKLEVPSLHMAHTGGLSPWKSGADFRADVIQAANIMPTIALCRDKGSGEVRVDRSGRPRLYYPVSQHDRVELTKGAEMLARLTASAGAEKILSNTLWFEGWYDLPLPAPPGAPEYERRRAEQARSQALERYCALIRERGVQTNEKAVLMSAHQMGTAKMSATPDRGVCKDTGEVWEIQGLYVADSSLFPTSSGANPMLTVMTLAYDMACRLQQTLQQGDSSATATVMSKL